MAKMMNNCWLAAVIVMISCSAHRKTAAGEPAKPVNPVIAHRGAWKMYQLPENSIASLKHAIALGCYGSEFDVRMTADEVLVINHDPGYNKLPIEKTTYAELIKTPLSNGERLPTLKEYIQAGLEDNPNTKLICEIKPSETGKDHGRKVAERTVQTIRELKAEHKVVYISFDYDILKKVLQLSPKANTQYLNGDKAPAQLKTDGIAGADYHYSVFKLHPDWIEQARQNNIQLNAWTVNEAAEMDWLLANGFDLITTNEPELLAKQLLLHPVNRGWKLVWSDEFNYKGLPDSSKWSYDVGGDGWGNNELEYYTNADTSNAMVKNGKLSINAIKQQKEKNTYTSARLVTKYRGDWLYGRIEVSAKLPAGRGIWPAIWMLPTDWAYGGWPTSGEIDIMEHVGFMPDSVFSSVHTESFNHVIKTQKTKGLFVSYPYNSFHLYAVEWYKDHIDFFVDDRLFFSFHNTGNGFKEWPFDKRFHLILNVAVGGNWGAVMGVDENMDYTTMQIDYVRVYRKQ